MLLDWDTLLELLKRLRFDFGFRVSADDPFVTFNCLPRRVLQRFLKHTKNMMLNDSNEVSEHRFSRSYEKRLLNFVYNINLFSEHWKA